MLGLTKRFEHQFTSVNTFLYFLSHCLKQQSNIRSLENNSFLERIFNTYLFLLENWLSSSFQIKNISPSVQSVILINRDSLRGEFADRRKNSRPRE